MKKRLLIALIIILLAINVYFVFWLYRQKNSPQAGTALDPITASPLPKQELTLTGTAWLGQDLPEQKTYCPDEIFLVADEGKTLTGDVRLVQLRSPDSANVSGGVLYLGYRGKPVTVSATYRAFDMLDDLENRNCFSDPFVLVKTITDLSRNSTVLQPTNLVEVIGRVACLPEKEIGPDGCALGLITQNDQYYALLNLTEAALLKPDNRLQVSGSLQSDFNSPYLNTKGLNVIKIKQI